MATADMYSSRGMSHMEEVMQKLIELFGSVLDQNVIQSIALKHDYNLQLTSNALLEELDLLTTSDASKVVNNVNNDTSTLSKNVRKSPANEKTSSSFSYSNALITTKSECNEGASSQSYESKFKSSVLNPYSNLSVCSKGLTKKEQEYERIVQHVRQGSRILIILRGLPGSGKSFLARQIIDRAIGTPDYSVFILSADDYFIDKRTNTYSYQPHKLQEAHEWNQHRAYNNMSAGISPVIIDNTNTQMWEMKSYSMIAANFGYIVEILEPFTSWAFDEKQLAAKNRHGVPRAKISEMHLRYEKNITPSKIFDTFKLSYLNQSPPVPRNYPPIAYNVASTLNSDKKGVDNTSGQQLTTETIDLIGFEDSPSTIYISDDTDDETDQTILPQPHNSNLLDSIMGDSDANKCDVLLPNNTESPSRIKKICISHNNPINSQLNGDEPNARNNNIAKHIEKAKDIYPSLNLSSWGLAENAVSSWESWDMVTPVNKANHTLKLSKSDDNIEIPKMVETCNSSTNTSSHDFSLLSNKDSHTKQHVKIVETTNRDINVGVLIEPPSSPPKKALLHKSSMTIDVSSEMKENSNEKEELEDLRMLFSGIPFNYLRDVYEKCDKNINWAVDLLLDDNKEILPSLSDTFSTGSSDKANRTLQIISKLETNTKPSKVAPNNRINSDLMEIKKHIEGSIEINKDFYSDHLMKIKHSKNKNTNKTLDLSSPSTSSNFDITSTASGEVLAVNSCVDMNDFESEINAPSNEDSDEDQIVEINLGDACISQLETMFGLPENFPRGFLPIVQIPQDLAEQLYAFYVQSVVVQMEAQTNVLDTIIKEDEELAKKLQAQYYMEEREGGRSTPDLNEIMKEQVADKAYRREVDEWKKLTPDTLATKLTIQKLVNSFPSVSKGVLEEILHAHNNSYQETVEVLLNSTDESNVNDPDGTIREPPISEATLSEMRMANEEKKLVENVEDLCKSANEYRDEANEYHRKHNECMQKAQQSFQRKQYAVAQFYSSLAKSYTQLYEQSNSLAATAFLDEHSKKLQCFQTIDLHYLYVKEAIPALDMFLDRNIRLMSDTNKSKEVLFIITGKGNRSPGRPRLKPAVMTHLRKRGLKFVLLNPGLLKVTIYSKSLLSSKH